MRGGLLLGNPAVAAAFLPLLRRKNEGLMKKFLFLLIVAAALVGAYMTCPEKDKHEDAIKSAVRGAVDEYSDQKDVPDNALTDIVKSVTAWGASTVLNTQLDYQSYKLFSVCRMKVDGEKRIVSLGLFDHIFTMDKDDILEALELKDK